MSERICSISGCGSPTLCRGWCRRHYSQWYRANSPKVPCSIEDCTKPQFAHGWCQMHYCRWKKHGDPLVVKHRHDGNRIDRTQRKRCEQCGDEFGPPPGTAHSQWHRRQFCGRRCKNAHAAKQQVKLPSTTRREGERWARWWEQQRRCEDRADIKAWQRVVYGKAAQRLNGKPTRRLFICSHCRACGETWVQYANRVDSDLCSACTKTKWRMSDRHRARHYGVEYECIDRFEVFAADGYRCQICKCKTRGKHPNPKSPTLDHIVPLSVGGPHLKHNVQTACLRCNTNKGNRTANDQMRLPLCV